MASNDKTIVYATREIERALGAAPNEHYLIVSNKTPYGETIKKQYGDFVTLIETKAGELLGTGELLAHLATKALVAARNADILVFKNTLRVEAVIKANGWKVINPPAILADRIENKITQVRWLADIGTKYLPTHATKLAKSIHFDGKPFVLQWAHGHTGDGTELVTEADRLRAIQEKFPERMARISHYIEGPSFTVNAVVTENRILMGNISYQITGLAPFSDNRFSTVGNDWGVVGKILGGEEIRTMQTIVQEIGSRLQRDGWRGLFGVDFMADEKSRRVYLIEVNARQPASATFESALQEEMRAKGARGLTTFEAHLRALRRLPIDQDLIGIAGGAQIVQRVTKNVQGVFDDLLGTLELAGYRAIVYQNTAYNADLVRVQSVSGIMEGHQSFNEKGREIMETIKNSRFNIEV